MPRIFAPERLRRERGRAVQALAAAGFVRVQPPEEGERPPAILFFSGGTAIKGIARVLPEFTPFSSHVITTFDSGGSSAELRRVFGLPALGDLRLRLTTLARRGEPRIGGACVFFERRFAARAGEAFLRVEWEKLLAGKHPWLEGLDREYAELFLQRLNALAELLPGDFNLRGASLGNLVLAAGCLITHMGSEPGEVLSEVMRSFAVLFQARGRLEPASSEFAHLGVKLASGRVLLGQHRFTGLKPGRTPLGADGGTGVDAREKILRLFYCAGLEDPTRLHPACGSRVRALIQEADLLCYPPGSFFSSILANVCLKGVGRAVAESRALKLYMPNPGPDPESAGLSLEERLEFLMEALLQDVPGAVPGDVLNCLLVDAAQADYPGGVPTSWCRKRGVRIIDYPFTLRTGGSGGFVPADPLRSALLLHLLAGTGRDGRGGGSYV